ncbi:hypothetical protein Acr_11g0014970 [Actinidia rufa]|uniref:Uncharacterized protein n=1 Tax=Actinidia rufa TaxID=165716 RepID=A0A7J0FER8_9ERIC|nr:hypothetical protein Acr_11g0014970 [Actinidia rufa]
MAPMCKGLQIGTWGSDQLLQARPAFKLAALPHSFSKKTRGSWGLVSRLKKAVLVKERLIKAGTVPPSGVVLWAPWMGNPSGEDHCGGNKPSQGGGGGSDEINGKQALMANKKSTDEEDEIEWTDGKEVNANVDATRIVQQGPIVISFEIPEATPDPDQGNNLYENLDEDGDLEIYRHAINTGKKEFVASIALTLCEHYKQLS